MDREIGREGGGGGKGRRGSREKYRLETFTYFYIKYINTHIFRVDPVPIYGASLQYFLFAGWCLTTVC